MFVYSDLIIFHVFSPLSVSLSLAPIPEAGQASVQPHPAHPGSQGGHEEQPLTVCTDFKMPLTGKSSSLSYWSTHDDHRQTASVIIVFQRVTKCLSTFFQCFLTFGALF
ncbi:hypothetical protein OYC64_022089 [Pagothenia borchgrevinki]|uniref:Secreted protein n=1 Tax=Pagothenia borchgrevinki TaxID=8213 RepID=A0ABD2HN57_PAGBO